MANMTNYGVSYHDIKVYSHVYDENTLFTCRGAAVNDLLQYGVSKSFRAVDPNIIVSRLIYDRLYDKHDVFIELDHAPCYRYNYAGYTSSWFLSDTAALSSEAAKNANEMYGISDPKMHIEVGYLNLKKLAHIDKEIRVNIESSGDGRFLARIASDPVHCGNLEKIYFPDRSWTDVCVGEAIVSIKKEFDNYGFITGKMIPYTMPKHMDKFITWLENMRHTAYNRVYHIKHSFLGEFYVVGSAIGPFDNHYRGIAKSSSFSVVTESVNIVNGEEMVGYTTVSATSDNELMYADDVYDQWNVDDFIGAYYFGDVEKYHELRKKLIAAGDACEFTDAVKYRLDDTQWINDDSIVASDVVSDAIDSDLIRPQLLRGYNICAYVVNPMWMNYFNADELDEIIEFVTKKNTEAAEAIRSKCRKGKLMIKKRQSYF